MNVVPCEVNKELREQIVQFSEELRTQSHLLGNHGLSEVDFYRSGLFRGAIERIRGQFSASMGEKREFVQHVLNFMQDSKKVSDWESAGGSNRHDYTVMLPDKRTAAIELKGCLDGNNTTIFERPANANEFVLWSVCTNPSADPRKNVWSGIHTRLSPEIITQKKQVDGLLVWDMMCGSIGRPCPKVINDPSCQSEVGPFRLPPPCIYVFPSTIPSARDNPRPSRGVLSEVKILDAFARSFKVTPNQVNYVEFEVRREGAETLRKTTIIRDDIVQIESSFTQIKRSD